MPTFFDALNDLMAAETPLVVVTVVDTMGSVPQDRGAKMIVTAEGLRFGTVGGGKVETKAIGEAQEMLRAENDETTKFAQWNLAKDVGMTCGGVVKLYFESHNVGRWRIVVFGAGHVANAVVNVLIHLDCAVTCLKVAGASALADHVPVLGLILGGIASAGDTIAITGLQIDMLLKISAAYGKRAEFARVVELLPVIGGGYGWRALARELSGFIPVAGIPIKAGIAYAGTLVVGQAASYYYEHGTTLNAASTKALYHDALERAKKLVSDMIERARNKK